MSERQVDFNLYLITDRKMFSDIDALSGAVEGALKGGIRAVQLREKDLPTRELLAVGYRMRELTSQYHARLFINDRADIALCIGADGVHLGQGGMPVYAVRKIVGNHMMIGVSTHSVQEARLAWEEGADFITLGPVYQTPSKLKYGPPVGLEIVQEVSREIAVPVFGIGGIKPGTLPPVIQSGAHGVAVISGILGADNTQRAAQNYLKAVKRNA